MGGQYSIWEQLPGKVPSGHNTQPHVHAVVVVVVYAADEAAVPDVVLVVVAAAAVVVVKQGLVGKL